jgi:thiamine pyrophosphate-dependent acetolactate synthase large subunit-like protein
MNLALKHAVLERDVSHLIFPDDMQMQPAEDGAEAGKPDGRIADPEIAPPAHMLGEAVERIGNAQRPVIIVGHGARFEMESVLELAEQLNAPVLTTFKGKGLIADDHPLAGGVLGRSGTPVASWFMNEADLLLVFGASFSNHTGITTHKQIIQVDFDRAQLGRFHAVDLALWGEIGVTAELLGGAFDGEQGPWIDQRAEVAERWAIWREEKQRRQADDHGQGIASAVVFDSLTRLAPEDAIFAVDVGNNTYSFGRYFECKRHAVLMSGYLGSIGFGYPAAMGAWAATRSGDERFAGRKVLCVTGDGGFGQYLAEVTTAVRHGMDITHVLLNNGQLGKISKEQRAGEWPVWETSLQNPNFAEFVTSCGGLGIRVEKPEDLDAALERALAFDGPATVEVLTDAELV